MTEFGSVTTLLPYRDRRAAGQVLADQLRRYAGRPGLEIVALPQGGVPVGFHVARSLRAPLDVLVVHKLLLPGDSGLAMGALASGGVCVLDGEVLRENALDSEAMKRVVADELPALERRETRLRGHRPPLDVRGRPVILVDDGVATGATLRVAIAGLRAQSPASITVAVPVGAQETLDRLASEVDEVVCPRMPEPFYAVGLSYDRFPELADTDVRALLDAAQQENPFVARDEEDEDEV